MISDHKQALEFLEAKYPAWYSPIAIRNNTDITLTDSTISRKLRQDRKDGRVKSKKIYMDDGRYYVAYAYKKSYRGNNAKKA